MGQTVNQLLGSMSMALLFIIAVIMVNAIRLKISLRQVLWAFEGYILVFIGVFLICLAVLMSMQGAMPKHIFIPLILGTSLLCAAIEGQESYFGL